MLERATVAFREGVLVQCECLVGHLVKQRETQIEVLLAPSQVLKLRVKRVNFIHFRTLVFFEQLCVLH
jgi:hypothetical protein